MERNTATASPRPFTFTRLGEPLHNSHIDTANPETDVAHALVRGDGPVAVILARGTADPTRPLFARRRAPDLADG